MIVHEETRTQAFARWTYSLIAALCMAGWFVCGFLALQAEINDQAMPTGYMQYVQPVGIALVIVGAIFLMAAGEAWRHRL